MFSTEAADQGYYESRIDHCSDLYAGHGTGDAFCTRSALTIIIAENFRGAQFSRMVLYKYLAEIIFLRFKDS